MKITRALPTKTTLLLLSVAVLTLIYVLQLVIAPNSNSIALPKIDSAITQVEIVANGSALRLRRNGQAWRVGEAEYPGDAAVINALVEAALAVESVDVVSQRGAEAKFGLAAAEEVTTLRLYVDEQAVLSFAFGADTAAGNAVYGRVQDEAAVVFLPSSLAAQVHGDAAHYRDKVIARLAEEEIAAIVFTVPNFDTMEIRRVAAPGDADEAELSAAERFERHWEVLFDGEPLPPAADSAAEGGVAAGVPGYQREGLFQELATLRAEGFLTAEPEQPPFALLKIARLAGGATEEIKLYPPDMMTYNYPLTTSLSDYVVTIPEFRVRRLLLGQGAIIDQFYHP